MQSFRKLCKARAATACQEENSNALCSAQVWIGQESVMAESRITEKHNIARTCLG